ncbi:type IV secretion system protein VirB3 [Marinobacterium arenosum]|uniref:type IV secretion system protein VirB3 n=1 Tax=Marinobacterium arenosum TaxID=2862496 RepID=UPI001C982EFB|nr:type IV secretion system protein VirB3 [Marinobacterium arenosum]
MINDTDPLFVGVTRPSMVGGITYEALIVCVMVTAVVFLGSGNIFTLTIYLPLHVISYLVCQKDPRAFRLLSLWVSTKGRSVSRQYWGASSATPLVNTRRNRGI